MKDDQTGLISPGDTQELVHNHRSAVARGASTTAECEHNAKCNAQAHHGRTKWNFKKKIYSYPRWGSLAENHSPESKGFRPMTKGEEPIQLYINIYIYMISSAPCFQPFSHFHLIS